MVPEYRKEKDKSGKEIKEYSKKIRKKVIGARGKGQRPWILFVMETRERF